VCGGDGPGAAAVVEDLVWGAIVGPVAVGEEEGEGAVGEGVDVEGVDGVVAGVCFGALGSCRYDFRLASQKLADMHDACLGELRNEELTSCSRYLILPTSSLNSRLLLSPPGMMPPFGQYGPTGQMRSKMVGLPPRAARFLSSCSQRVRALPLSMRSLAVQYSGGVWERWCSFRALEGERVW
jgi:hypothetical protein